jgi:nitrite reductase/ring-hydroxylating ferredoxin subunit
VSDLLTSDCDHCPLASGRRAFLHAAAHAAGAFAVLVLTPRGAAALWSSTTQRYAIPATDGAVIDRDNQVILVRWQDAIYAFALSCPHQNTALRWLDADGRFQCPKHHSRYQPDGTFISGRATRNMDRLTITRDGDAVVVDVDALHKSTDDAAGWAAAVIHLASTHPDSAAAQQKAGSR